MKQIHSAERAIQAVFLICSAALILSPWLIATETADLFAHQGRLVFFLGSLSLTGAALLLSFGRFRHLRLPFLTPALLLGSAIGLSTLLSPFLTTLRQGFLWISLILILFFLRLIWRNRFTRPMAYLICLSGTTMSVYGLFQSFGFDPIHWVDSQFVIVGTFSNPNFLAAYLLSTALLSCGLLKHDISATPVSRLLLGSSMILQVGVLILTKCAGAQLCFIIGLCLLRFRFWEVPSQRWFQISPLVGGLVLSLMLICFYAILSLAARHYPWETLARTPWDHLSFVTRILEFHMGFNLFLQHPLTGLGPGASPYLLSALRPPLGNLLGLANFNDDPHSVVLTLLSETGLFGLLGFSSLIAAAFGVHRWHRYRHTPQLGLPEAFSQTVTGGTTLSTEMPAVFAVPVIGLILHSLFNSTLSILPLTLHLILLAGCHQAACLRESYWQRGINWFRMPWLLLVPLYLVTGWSLEQNYQRGSRQLFAGQQAMNRNDFPSAEKAFSNVLMTNPQSLKGLMGLAVSQENQGRLAQAQDILGKLDQLSPNVFGVRLHLSRIFLERRQLLEAHRWALLHLQWSQSPTAYELLGRILLLEGRLVEAEQAFQEGLFHVPFLREEEVRSADRMRLYLGELALDKGEMETARGHLQALSSIESRSPEAFFLLGRLNYDAGIATAALTFFEKAYAADKNNPRFGNALGYLLAERNEDLLRARSILERAYKDYKSQPSPRLQDILSVTHSLGMLYSQIGEVAKAKELLLLAFDQTPVAWREAKEARSRDLNQFLARIASSTNPDPASSSSGFRDP